MIETHFSARRYLCHHQVIDPLLFFEFRTKANASGVLTAKGSLSAQLYGKEQGRFKLLLCTQGNYFHSSSNLPIIRDLPFSRSLFSLHDSS